jgi:hypothetical protein
VANAGHVAGVVYTETSLPLRPSDRVTLVSDGVVEAASAKGGLFGFERTREAKTQSGSGIAEAAKDQTSFSVFACYSAADHTYRYHRISFRQALLGSHQRATPEQQKNVARGGDRCGHLT